MEPRIHLALRFHTNFYHSYRGDTPDEFGFGKDIRIIRSILQTLAGAGAGAIGAYIGGTIADHSGYLLLVTMFGVMFLLSSVATLFIEVPKTGTK
jgi:hypothetical protein